MFEHGVESPVIDASRPGADQFKTVQLASPEEGHGDIRSITMREYWPNFNMLKVGYADGSEQTICEYHPSGQERTLHLPEGFQLAGFFGRNDNGYFIRSLGFILMQYH